MVERFSYHAFGQLSPASTELLLQGDFTPSVIGKLQSELQAYFSYNKSTFGGFLYHRDGKGPEKPYFKPEGSDWTPEIQAISRIGVQYYYWDALHTSLSEARIDPVHMMSMVILVVHINPDGSSYLATNSTPEQVKMVAERCGDGIPRYSCHIPSINYGGDADFYGAWQNQIFPMEVKTMEGNQIYVARDKLGIPVDLVKNTWQSWRDLIQADTSFYHQVTLETYQNLSPQIAIIIGERLKKGEFFRGEWAIWRAVLKDNIMIDDETVQAATAIVNDRARAIMTRNKDLLQAAKTHSDNLFQMYDIARTNRQDIYHY